MVYLVTGASGLLGANLVRLLVEEGAAVRALVQADADARTVAVMGATCIAGDVRDPEAVDAAVRGCAGVFHCAAGVSPSPRHPELFHTTNVAGTANVARAALRNQVPRLVYVSAADTFGRRGDARAADETVEHAPGPHDLPYVASKWACPAAYPSACLAAERSKTSAPVTLIRSR